MAYDYTVTNQDSGGLNTIANRFGFDNYKSAGVASVPSGNFDQIKAGDVIHFGNYNGPTTTPVTPTPPAGAPPTGAPDLHAVINQNQGSDIASATNGQVPTKDSTTTLPDSFSDLKNTLSSLNSPGPSSLTTDYSNLRSQYHVDTLEQQLSSLNAESKQLNESKTASVTAEQGKPVAMNVINGRVGEQERNWNTRINENTLQRDSISNQVKNAYTAIDTIMKYKEADYTNAKNDYNTKFTQAISLYDASNKQQDNARANLSVLYNSIKDGGADLSHVDDATKLSIAKMELQAGLPVGFYQYLQSKNPKADVLWTGTTNTANGKYAQVMTQDPKTGARSIQSYYLGEETSTAANSNDTIGKDLKDAQDAITGGADAALVRQRFLETHPGKGSYYNDYFNDQGGA